MNLVFGTKEQQELLNIQRLEDFTQDSDNPDSLLIKLVDYFTHQKSPQSQEPWKNLSAKIIKDIKQKNTQAEQANTLFNTSRSFAKACQEGQTDQACQIISSFFISSDSLLAQPDTQDELFVFTFQLNSLFLQNHEGKNPLYLALEAGHESLVKRVLTFNYPPQIYRLIFSANTANDTLFHLAMRLQKKSLISYFLSLKIPADLAFPIFASSQDSLNLLTSKWVERQVMEAFVNKLSLTTLEHLLDVLEIQARQNLLGLLDDSLLDKLPRSLQLIGQCMKEQHSLAKYWLTLAKKEKLSFAFKEEVQQAGIQELLDLFSKEQPSEELLRTINKPYVELFYEAKKNQASKA